VDVAYGCGLILFQQGDENSRGRGSFEGFLPHWQCIAQHSIWDPYKNGWTDWGAVWDAELEWPKDQCVTWEWRSPKVKGQFWEKTCPTSFIPLIIGNWTDSCSSTRQGRHLIACIGQVYYRPCSGRCDCIAWV